ncbi:uncharacterized protein LOC129609449 [Condylostylus longicornis]|uniref:uncharacterized protein LOC129609449 n=1 Tax=Condylostylus longicornis TaxID=2530218 RepID=UPI00244E4DE0|nr:uncharacterized protein LOC129609449 [Condylostylus longicornis]
MLNLLSSLKITLFQNSCGLFKCSLANFKRLILLVIVTDQRLRIDTRRYLIEILSRRLAGEF